MKIKAASDPLEAATAPERHRLGAQRKSNRVSVTCELAACARSSKGRQGSRRLFPVLFISEAGESLPRRVGSSARSSLENVLSLHNRNL